MIARRALLSLLVLAAFIPACEHFSGDGYTWYRRGAPARSFAWVQLSSADLLAKCGDPNFAACAHYDWMGGDCIIYSRYSETQALDVKTNGRSLFEHEVGPLDSMGRPDPRKRVGHCAGFDHRERYVRGI